MTECRAIQSRLGRYFDGELSHTERRLVEDHLKECGRCSANLQEICEIAGAFQKGMSTPPVPPDLTQGIMQEARKQVGCTPPVRSFLGFWKNWSFGVRFAAMGVAAAACYVGIVIGSASPSAVRRAGEEMKWIGMTSQGPIVKAYMGRDQ
jgi:anti-sigma factor RsiW